MESGEPTHAAAVEIEACAARHEKPQALSVLVVFALDPALPRSPLVELVEYHERLPRRPPRGANLPAIVALVPTQIEPRSVGLQKPASEGRLSHLARAGQKDHLLGQIRADRSFEIAILDHTTNLATSQIVL